MSASNTEQFRQNGSKSSSSSEPSIIDDVFFDVVAKIEQKQKKNNIFSYVIFKESNLTVFQK